MTQIAAHTQQLAAWITDQARVHNVALESLDATAVAREAGVSPQAAAQAIAEAIRVRTAALRSQLTPTNVSQGGTRLQMNTPQTLQARATPQQHFHSAQQAFARGDYASEAAHLADYWNSYAGAHVLGSDLVPAAGAERSVQPNSPHAALLYRLRNEPTPGGRLQLLRDFVAPKQQPQQADLVSRVTSGLGKLMSNPTGLMALMNPTAALFMAATQQQPQQPAKPVTLYDSLMAKAGAAHQQHQAANRPYPAATVVAPLVQRFATAVDTLDERLRPLLVSAFEQALQRADGQAVDQLVARSEVLAKEAYDAKLKAALGG